MKKCMLSFIVASCLLLATSAQAAWYTVTVDNVGADNTTVNLRITDDGGKFSRIWVQASGATSDQIMASALTAMSLNKKLLVNIGGVVSWVPLLGAYVVN